MILNIVALAIQHKYRVVILLKNQNPFIQFDSIKVNYLEKNCGIFVGTNQQNYWCTSFSDKAGFGIVSGYFNRVSKNINLFHDHDLIDTPIRTYTLRK